MAAPTVVAPTAGGAWSLQSKNSALQGRWHDMSLLGQGAATPLNATRDGVLATSTSDGINVSDLIVYPQASPNQTANIWYGAGVVTRAGQGSYMFYNVGNVIVNFDAAHATLARIDVVYAQVLDTVFSESATTLQFGVVTGTPAASPTVPALPAGACLKLAEVAVPSIATRSPNKVQSGDLTDKRKSAATFDGVRYMLPGDALADVGFKMGELRDSTPIASGTGLDRWTGAAWVPMVGVNRLTWTPTIAGMTSNAGTAVGRYTREGKIITAQASFVPTAANLGVGTVTCTLPVAISASAAGYSTGTGFFIDGSGVIHLMQVIGNPGASTVTLYGVTGTSYVTPGNAGYSWTNPNSRLDFQIQYEV